jgi:hypothetical protein
MTSVAHISTTNQIIENGSTSIKNCVFFQSLKASIQMRRMRVQSPAGRRHGQKTAAPCANEPVAIAYFISHDMGNTTNYNRELTSILLKPEFVAICLTTFQSQGFCCSQSTIQFKCSMLDRVLTFERKAFAFTGTAFCLSPLAVRSEFY